MPSAQKKKRQKDLGFDYRHLFSSHVFPCYDLVLSVVASLFSIVVDRPA